tara:strand:- start:173 stop:469 length:297 start_codon:yes stop_codon:yes gene_type:complete
MNFDTSLLWVLLLGSLLGLELIGKVPPTLHTPLMSGANAISGITMLAALTAIINSEPGSPLLIIGSIALGFALFNVVGGFLVTDRMLAMFSRKPNKKK